MQVRITASPGADGTPENSLAYIVYALSLPVDALLVDVCRRPGVPGYAPASLTDVFLPWEAVRQTVSSLSDLVLCPPAHGDGASPPTGAGYGSPPTGTGYGSPTTGAGYGSPPNSGRNPPAEDGDTGIPAPSGGGGETSLSPAEEPLSLRQVFQRAAAHSHVRVHCALRDPGLEEAVCALALECGMAGRIILSGKLDPALCAASPLVPRMADVYLDTEELIPSFYRGFREFPDYDARTARTMLDLCARTGFRTVHIRQDKVTRRFIETLRSGGAEVSAWTVDAPEDLRWFLSSGAADICTRNLAPALALRG